MIEVKRTNEFADWFVRLKDKAGKARINRYLEKITKDGLSGDIKPVGDGVSEMRFHFGPGYRVYFVKHGLQIIVLIGGGTKATQDTDIANAKKLASKLKE